MGEYEYSSFLSADEEDSGQLYIPQILFLLFIILNSIVLINLMVGLAVSDIQELHKQGRTKKLEKQAEFLSQLEKVIRSKHLKHRKIHAVFGYIINKHSKIEKMYILKTSRDFQRSEGIPRRIIGMHIIL